MSTLYICGTPIGNLSDISKRLIDVLQKVDRIVAEDTRQTLKLLQHLQIHKPMVSFFRHNIRRRIPELLEYLRNGENLALVTDAGMPGISDPGPELIQAVVQGGFTVECIPGPSAVTAALAISGFPADQFVFLGFLPVKSGKRKKILTDISGESRTVVFFESPHRIAKTLKELGEILPDRSVVVCRELTKKFETIYRGRGSEILEKIPPASIRGEFTVVIGPLD